MREERPKRSPSRRALPAAVLVTLLVVALGLLDGAPARAMRTWAGAALGPLERVLGVGSNDEVSRLRADNERLADELRQARAGTADATALADLMAAPATSGATVVPARVVAMGRVGAAGPERLTVDVGARDGVSIDLTVVAAGGLVGRVISTSPWTSDVALLGAPEVVVGARVGSAGRMGTVGPAATGGSGTRRPGELNVQLVMTGPMAVGDEVTTLGSVDGRPFVAGVPVGRVASVDPGGGRLTASGALEPAVDLGSLRVVGVLLTAPRSTPRPSVTGGAP